ncbi:MAG: M56 family metallopeptidase, partial [Lachnospiraceae bacterium]|nr:M56 family metallopeptidase [Lachnospiraceae bacterium]
MYEVFTKLLNMSLTASLLVIAVILLRIVLKKVPKRSICILWVLVAFRLIVPFSITSSASVFNVVHMGSNASERMEYFQYNGKTEKPTLTFDIPSGENADVYPNIPTSEINEGSESFEPATAEKHTAKIYLPAVMMVWALGVAAILIYAMISFFELRKNVAASIPQTKNIYICDEINSPFILGIVRPRIYLPSSLKDGVKEHVIAHEQAHLKRFDHLWKPIGFLLLAVYWFNPILWLAYVLFCRDIEAACDEKVIEDFDRQWKVKYSEALLSCAVERRMITICPLAFGETNVKGRVKGVLNYKKPAFWVTGVTAIICVIMAI